MLALLLLLAVMLLFSGARGSSRGGEQDELEDSRRVERQMAEVQVGSLDGFVWQPKLSVGRAAAGRVDRVGRQRLKAGDGGKW